MVIWRLQQQSRQGLQLCWLPGTSSRRARSNFNKQSIGKTRITKAFAHGLDKIFESSRNPLCIAARILTRSDQFVQGITRMPLPDWNVSAKVGVNPAHGIILSRQDHQRASSTYHSVHVAPVTVGQRKAASTQCGIVRRDNGQTVGLLTREINRLAVLQCPSRLQDPPAQRRFGFRPTMRIVQFLKHFRSCDELSPPPIMDATGLSPHVDCLHGIAKNAEHCPGIEQSHNDRMLRCVCVLMFIAQHDRIARNECRRNGRRPQQQSTHHFRKLLEARRTSITGPRRYVDRQLKRAMIHASNLGDQAIDGRHMHLSASRVCACSKNVTRCMRMRQDQNATVCIGDGQPSRVVSGLMSLATTGRCLHDNKTCI